MIYLKMAERGRFLSGVYGLLYTFFRPVYKNLSSLHISIIAYIFEVRVAKDRITRDKKILFGKIAIKNIFRIGINLLKN